MNDKVLKAIKEYNMIADGDTIVVGVSGGADSISLLHFLHNHLKKVMNINVIAAHINHCLRGAESDRDEQYVREFCRKNGIELHVAVIKIDQEAAKDGIGIEECGRKKRYEFFNSIVTNRNFKIATAHTLSDSIETVIMNMCRGTGLHGMCGIPPVRENIIRPLILSTRQDVEYYCRENHLDYVTDSSNLSREYTRNMIRLDVIPVFKSINPLFETSMSRTIQQLMQDDMYFNDIVNNEVRKAKQGDSYDINKINCLPDAIKYRVLIKIISLYCNERIEKKHIDLIVESLKEGNGAVNIPGNYYVAIRNGLLNVSQRLNFKKQNKAKINNKEILTGNRKKFIIKEISIKEYLDKYKINKLLFNICFDYDTISNGIVFRSRKAGDKFAPANRGITKTLKNLFNEKKIAPEIRDDITIISDDKKILWIEGIGPSELSKVTDKTKRVAIVLKESNYEE